MKRNRRAGVEDLWTKTVRDEHGNQQTVPSARHGIGMRWRARYVDDRGQEHSKAFPARPMRRSGWTARLRRSCRGRTSHRGTPS